MCYLTVCVTTSCVVSRDELLSSFTLQSQPAFKASTDAFSVESKDGRHHYAAHSSKAKIRADRQAAQRRARNPRDFSSNLLFVTDTKLHHEAENKPQRPVGSAEVKQAEMWKQAHVFRKRWLPRL